MTRMTVERLGDGLWTWASPHPAWQPGDDWNRMAYSTYVEADDAVVLIDPLVPTDPQEAERFWHALDRDVERLALPVAVLLTCRWHARSAADLHARYGATVWSPDADIMPSRPLADAARPAAGVEARALGVVEPDLEVAFLLADHDAIVVGDIVHVGDDGPALSPATWHDDTPATHAWFAEHAHRTLRALLTPAPALLLTGHAPSLAGDAVRRFADGLGMHEEPPPSGRP